MRTSRRDFARIAALSGLSLAATSIVPAADSQSPRPPPAEPILDADQSWMATPPFTSEQLATEWRPYIETCIEAFGANRRMVESGFPVDATVCTYPYWNTFKRLAAGASKEEKTALFSGTATRVYRLDVCGSHSNSIRF
jgi:amidohydrolase family protein